MVIFMKKQILSALTAVMTAFSICGTAVTAAETATAAGDLNGDGKFTVADVVVMQNWLLGKKGSVIDASAVDFCKDGKLDVFDFILMKKKFIMNNNGDTPEDNPIIEEPTQYGFYSYDDYEKFIDENELSDKIPTYEDIKEIGEFVHFSINYGYSSGFYFPMSFVLDDGSGDTVLLNISDGKVSVGDRAGKNLLSHQVDFSDMRTVDTTAEKSFFDFDDRSYNYENGKLASIEWYTEDCKYLLVGTPALWEYPDVEETYVSELLDLTSERRNALERLQSATPDDISKVDIMLMPPCETVGLSKPQIEEMLTLMKDVKAYEYDNSHLEYGGQSIMFTITYADGETMTITDFNPFIIINHVGFRTEYEPAQALSVFANSVYSEYKKNN